MSDFGDHHTDRRMTRSPTSPPGPACLGRLTAMAARTAATVPIPNPNTNSSPDPSPRGDWTVALSRRRRRRGGEHGKNASDLNPNPNFNPDLPETLTPTQETLPWTPSDSGNDAERISTVLQKMRSSMTKLETSGFYRRFLSQLQENPRIQENLSRVSSSSSPSGPPEMIQVVVYGVGSIESYEPPRLQLSLALLLKRELGGASAVEVFDPVLSAAECAAAEALGCRVIPVDERGRRAVERPTLFYMPHCEAVLYDNLLAVNWGQPAALGRMVVLGNSFGEYGRYVEEGLGGRGSVAVAEKARHVLGAREFLEEIGIGKAVLEEEALFRAFNETSWHFFHFHGDAGADHLALASEAMQGRKKKTPVSSQA